MNPPSITISQERSCWWISNTCENPHVKAEVGSQKVQPSVLRESGFWTIEKWEAKKKYLSLLREVQSEKKDLRSRSRNESEMKMTGNRNREVKVKWKSFKIEIEKWNFSIFEYMRQSAALGSTAVLLSSAKPLKITHRGLFYMSLKKIFLLFCILYSISIEIFIIVSLCYILRNGGRGGTHQYYCYF